MSLPGDPRVAPSAQIDPTAHLELGTVVWDLTQVREKAVVGESSSLGRGVYVGPGVIIGPRCRIQNHALLYEPAVLDAGVFIGPAVVLTNDVYPRAVMPDGTPKTEGDWAPVGVTVRTGASIGARAVCVAPVEIGAWALVAAGAIVTRDVAEYALVAGSPARRIGWVGRSGARLVAEGDSFRCPVTGESYREQDGTLSLVGH